MHKPIWSWTNTLTRLGFSRPRKPNRQSGPRPRRLQLEPLEPRHLLSGDLGTAAFAADPDALIAQESIAALDPSPQEILQTILSRVRPQGFSFSGGRMFPSGGTRSGGEPSPGDLDASFDEDGVVTTRVSPNDDCAFDVAVQPDGKILATGYAIDPSTGSDFALVRYLPDGTRDPTFNGDGDDDGMITTDFFGGTDEGYALAIQSDGKIVVVGVAGYDFGLVRYNVNGSLDDGGPNDITAGDSFGTGGKVTTDFLYNLDGAFDVAIDAEERLVVAGYAYHWAHCDFDFALARYLPDGQLDQSFDGDGDNDGKIMTDFVGTYDTAFGLSIFDDGRIVLGGGAYDIAENTADFALARYLSNGAPDGTFGTGGLVTTNFQEPNDSYDHAYGVAIHEDGGLEKIVAVGVSGADSAEGDFALARYLPNGDLDGTFGKNADGKVTTDFSGGYDFAWSVAIGPGGKIVACGSAQDGQTDYDFGLARYNVNGSLDDGDNPDDDAWPDISFGDSFGTGGKVTTDIPDWPGGNNAGYGCTLDEGGRVLLAGFAGYPAGDDFMVARYLAWPDVEITGFAVDGEDSDKLQVQYRINHLPVDPFHIGIYASADRQASGDDTLLMSYEVSDPDYLVPNSDPNTPYTVTIPVAFQPGPGVYDLEEDYFLIGMVDADQEVSEVQESNNDRVFEGGIFRDRGWDPMNPVNIVHVHGTDTPYPDPGDEKYDKRDIVRLEVDENIYYVYLNDPDDFDPAHPAFDPEDPDPPPPPPFHWAGYSESDVFEFHIRTHDGEDSVWTPYWRDPEKINQSGFFRAIWAFGGNGGDELFGSALADRLYGGPGDDVEIVGRAGHDTIHGGPGDDVIEGNDGCDTIYGEGGNDRIEGWGNINQPELGIEETIYGDYHWLDPLSGTDDGDDIITGGATPDPRFGEPDGADIIYGGGGNDRIDGYEGDDWICGDYDPLDPLHPPNPNDPPAGAGNDEIYGWAGDDWIMGGPGNDNLFGEQGEDTIYGGDYSGVLGGITYPLDDDWIFPDLQGPPLTPAQDIDLVTDIDDPRYHSEPGYGTPNVIEPWPGSEDNREENGFYGGKDDLYASVAQLYEMQIHVNDPFSNDPQKTLTGKDMILDWDGEVINVYLDAQKTIQIQPGYTWTITDPWEPVSIYVEAVNRQGTGTVETTMTLTLDPDPGTERPLADLVWLTVFDDLA